MKTAPGDPLPRVSTSRIRSSTRSAKPRSSGCRGSARARAPARREDRGAQPRRLDQGPRGDRADRGGGARRQAQARAARSSSRPAATPGPGWPSRPALKGYRVIAVMPDKMSKEKIDLLRAYGAEVVVAPTDVPPDSPESYYRVADRLTEEIPGAFQPNQYSNQANPEAHYRTTGPELWRQSGGQITHFVAGVGTGGTITGVGRYLREQKPGHRDHRRRPGRLDLLGRRGQALPRRGRRARTSGPRRTTRRWSTATSRSPTATRSSGRAGSPRPRASSPAARAGSRCTPPTRWRARSTTRTRWSP